MSKNFERAGNGWINYLNGLISHSNSLLSHSNWWVKISNGGASRTEEKTVQMDVETIRADVRTVQMDVAILWTDANVFRTDMQIVRTVCQMLWTDFFRRSNGWRTDKKQCPFCLLRSHIMHVYSENIQLLCAYFRVVMLMMFSFKMLLTDSGGIFLKSWQITLPWLSFISNTALTSSPQ